MKKWIIFFKERTPLLSYIIICLGPSLSAYFINNKSSVNIIFLTFFGFFLFFIVLRMMDEFKDYEKDLVAHSNRPLPRGLINLLTFEKAILVGVSCLIFFDIILFFLGFIYSFFLFSLVILHLWLMYKEFYLGKWLSEKPLFYAITHQLILVTLCFFALSLTRNNLGFLTPISFLYSFSVLFSFFSYEVCRKLNPSSHLVLKTYLQVYKFKGVLKITSMLILMHLLVIHFSFNWNILQLIFYIPLIFLFGSLIFLDKNLISFKSVELIATLNLIFFLYSGVFYVYAFRII